MEEVQVECTAAVHNGQCTLDLCCSLFQAAGGVGACR